MSETMKAVVIDKAFARRLEKNGSIAVIVELAGADALYERPQHPYTKALLSAIPEADPGSRWLDRRIQISGELPDPADPPAGCKFSTRCPYADDKCRAEAPPLTPREPGHFVACHKV